MTTLLGGATPAQRGDRRPSSHILACLRLGIIKIFVKWASQQRQLHQLQKDNAKLDAEIEGLRRVVTPNRNLETISTTSEPDSGHLKGGENLRARMRLHSLLFRR